MSIGFALFCVITALLLALAIVGTRIRLRSKRAAKDCFDALANEQGWEVHRRAGPWYHRSRFSVRVSPTADPIYIWWAIGRYSDRTFLISPAEFQCRFTIHPGPLRRPGAIADPTVSSQSYTFSPSDASQMGRIPPASISSWFGLTSPIVIFRRGHLRAQVSYLPAEVDDLRQLFEGFQALRSHMSPPPVTHRDLS